MIRKTSKWLNKLGKMKRIRLLKINKLSNLKMIFKFLRKIYRNTELIKKICKEVVFQLSKE